MLIYNFQKEFLGIDAKDLETLCFKSLAELRAEVTDFADLFVKTPGYVHNFQHVHWIDFISYADVSEESKVLINVNSKTFKATITISTIFLIDNPSSPAYGVHLNNLRPLSKSENNNLSKDVLDRELPEVQHQEPKVFTPAPKPEVAPAVVDEYDTQEESLDVGDLSLDVEDMYAQEEITEPTPVVEEPQPEVAPVIEEQKLELAPEPEPDLKPEPDIKPMQSTKTVTEDWDNGYTYDPTVASKELGLPVDLIEEFIQDFIAQAKEFKPQIYTSIEEGDVDNVKILSHKLKGVAANLRIEDAYEVLSTVSATSDMDVIHENLDTFYKIIAKLSGEPIQKVVEVEEEPEEPEEAPITLDFKDDDDLLDISLDEDEDEEPQEEKEEEKLDLLEIDDSEVPQKIEMPELADDDFLQIDTQESNEDIEEENIFHYSKENVATEIGLDQESFNELFNDFIHESHEIFGKIKNAVEENNLQISKNEALKLKGMSDNMRLDEFTNELETLIHSQDKDEMAEAVRKIDATLTKISKIGA